MKVPYSIQGALFAPVFAILVFFLKLSCPAGQVGCFADLFLKPVFMPLPFIDQVLGSRYSFIQVHEPFVILIYWMLVGFVTGLFFDLIRRLQPRQDRI